MNLYAFVSFATLFLSSFITSSGQENKVDSLKNEVLKAEHDSTKCNAYLEIGYFFEENYPDSALHYYSICFQLAESKNLKNQQAKALNYSGIVNSNTGKYKQAIEFFTKSAIIYEKIGNKMGISNNYNSIGIVYAQQGNYELAIDFLKKSLKLDQELSDKKRISVCLNNIGLVHWEKGDYNEALEYYLKSLEIRKELGDQKGIASSYNNIGLVHWKWGNYDSAIVYYQKSVLIREEIGDKRGASSVYGNMGNIFLGKGDYDKAIEYYLVSSRINEDLYDTKGLADNYNNIGLVYKQKGSYDQAFDYFMKSLRIREEIGDKKGISTNYSNIALVQKSMGNQNLAREYYLKSLQISEDIGDKSGLSNNYNEVGNFFMDQGNYNQAIEYFHKALKINKEIGDKGGISSSLINIGNYHKLQSDYDKAIDYYQESLKLKDEIGDKSGISILYTNIASLYILLADSVEEIAADRNNYLNSSIRNGIKALMLSEELGALPIKKDAANTLMNAYQKMGNHKKAMEYASIYITANDSLFSLEKTKAITEMQTKYETEKKQQEIENQQLVIEKQEIENKRQRAQRNFFIGGSVLLALLVLLIFRGYQQKKRSNIIITQKNALLEEANEEIRTQNEEIIAQRDEIEAQRDQVTEQKERIEQQNKHITDSINYAQRIQAAVLPRSNFAESILGDHFILFKPKDIVSGDFYWATRINHWLIFTVADCTGHGVPGAFMSMLGISFLKEIVAKKEVTQANEVLNMMRESIIDALQQKGELEEQQDGMDMVLCVLNTDQIQYAGANNPLYIVNAKKEFQIIRPDKQPVAIHQVMKPFTNNEIKVNKGDTIYLTSDGFQDQFGGSQNTKFMVKNLRDLLVSNADKPMVEQKNFLEEAFEKWKGTNPQIDDVTVMGIRV